MDGSSPSSANWEEIELSESYLVSSMYEEAASLASSILRRIQENAFPGKDDDALELWDMIESSGMVLVQSLNRLGRTSEIFKELKKLFSSTVYVPVLVLLTGACFQLSEGLSCDVKGVLEKFLCMWIYEDGKCVCLYAKANLNAQENVVRICNLEIDEYMSVVELYTVTLLGTVLKDVGAAFSWLEGATLPEERRLGLLGRLQSIYVADTVSPLHNNSGCPQNKNKTVHSSQEMNGVEMSQEAFRKSHMVQGKNDLKQALLKFFDHLSLFWWFPHINLKLNNYQIIMSNGKLVLGFLLLLLCFILRRKQAKLRLFVRRGASFLRRSFVELWQLTFSYQLNPLVAAHTLLAPPL